MIRKTDKEREDSSIDINNYKSKKYDGIVAYLGMLNGMEMMAIDLEIEESDKCDLNDKQDPFEKYKMNPSRSTNEQVTGCLMGTTSDSQFKSRWDKCNNLEKKVFMLKYYLSVGTKLMKLGLSDQFPNVREMGKNEIKQHNALLNGAMMDMMGGMAGDQENVECKQQ